MKSAFSSKWNSSKRPAKQRKYRYNAPLHTLRKFLSVHLSNDLRTKYAKRSISVVKGDKVKVVRGQFKGRENKVDHVNTKKTQIYVVGIEMTKKDGSKSMIPLNPTNIMITELNLSDTRRKARLERTTDGKVVEKEQTKPVNPTNEVKSEVKTEKIEPTQEVKQELKPKAEPAKPKEEK